MTQVPNTQHVRVFREDDTFVPLGGAAVTIGRFDGVHRGHQALLRATCRAAAAQDEGRAIAVTLWPPPEWVLRPSEPRRLLTTLDDRIDLLAASGVDDVIVLRFDRQFSRRSADEFLHDLIERLEGLAAMGARHISFGPPLGPHILEAIHTLGRQVLPHFRQSKT